MPDRSNTPKHPVGPMPPTEQMNTLSPKTRNLRTSRGLGQK